MNTTVVSPKVKASAWMTLAVTLAGAVLAGVTTWATGLKPEDVPMLGVWALPAITLLTGALNVLAGYLKRDKLMDAGAAALATGDPAVVSAPLVPALPEADAPAVHEEVGHDAKDADGFYGPAPAEPPAPK